MKKTTTTVLMVAASSLIFPAASSLAEGSGLPGDRGRLRDGIPLVNPPQRPPGSMQRSKARALSAELAVKAAEAIAAGCQQYPLAVTIVNADGEPTLMYIPDGTEPGHGYTALRKAYTAITFQTSTSQLVKKAQTDESFAAKIKADTNLMAFSGGILLKVGDTVLGAIGVSGAEPGGHDEECGLIGFNKIKDHLR